jgi:hypothetical protein
MRREAASMYNRMRHLLLASCLLVGLPGTALAQDAKTATAFATDAVIRIDGVLDEPVWEAAPVIDGFLQRDPREGEAGSERTEVRVVYTRQSLIFGVICHDSDPRAIRATELRRDNDFENDDSFSIVLDTFHDHRSAFLFRTNALGTQSDALITDEGRVTNTNWDEKWNVVATMGQHGWTLEIEIPFKALRTAEQPVQTWGLDFERIIRRRTEFTYWNNYRRGFTFKQVSQAGHLEGLENLNTGLTWRIKPFVRTALVGESVDGSRADLVSLSTIGVEDVKYRVTPNLTLDFTLNPDFAEADVDEQVLNLTRFPVFFEEKREFFLEGAGIFDFGPGPAETSELKLFFSRRIGLSPQGEPIPIMGGGKLTGKASGWTLGMMNLQTRESHGIPGRNFSVVRVKKDVFARSNVGAIVTNRQSARADDPYNRAVGADANFTFLDHLNVQSFATATYAPGQTDDPWAGRVRTYWDSDLIFANVEHLVIGEDFNPELGWVPRRDLRKTKAQFDLKPRPRSGSIRQLAFRTSVDYLTNRAGHLETRTQDVTGDVSFQSGDRFFVRYSRLFDRIDEPFQMQGLVPVPAGDYRWHTVLFHYFPSAHRALSGTVVGRKEWGFYGGSHTQIGWSPLLKLSKNVSMSPRYRFSHVTLPRGRFDSHLVNSQFNYAFSTRWLTSVTAQYNSTTDFVGINLRVNYIYRLGDDFFLVYNESKTVGVDGVPGRVNRSLIAKLTFSLDFY